LSLTWTHDDEEDDDDDDDDDDEKRRGVQSGDKVDSGLRDRVQERERENRHTHTHTHTRSHNLRWQKVNDKDDDHQNWNNVCICGFNSASMDRWMDRAKSCQPADLTVGLVDCLVGWQTDRQTHRQTDRPTN